MRTSVLLVALASVLLHASAVLVSITNSTSAVGSSLTSTISSTTTKLSTSTKLSSSTKPASASATTSTSSYWLETIKHQGISAFNPNTTYQVFRNVKDFGAKGDGVTDDTAAIQNAMSTGFRCAPGSCQGSTITPAIVYFPTGTYLISSSIVDYYYTQIIGNPNRLPVLKPTANFNGFGLIDGDQYGAQGLGFGATNVFYRQIRNIVFDLTGVDPSNGLTALHWPTSQATSLQNCVFKMSDAPGTQHQGIFIEGGSGGFMSDLVFYGGLKSVVFGNQQFTTRNLTMYNAVIAVYQLWDWGWTYQGLSVNNCSVGIDMSNGGPGGQAVGSVTVIDSSFSNTGFAILTAHNSVSHPATAGSVILENVVLTKTPVAVQGPDGMVLKGGSTTIAGWGQGHKYTAQITVYAGRGLYCASAKGSIWMVGTSVEHHDLYQYQFADTKSIFAGQIQTETAYWQPNPKAGAVATPVAGWNDPVFGTACASFNGRFAECAMGWGLRIVNSQSILIYGAGLYSFFNNYSVACSDPATPPGGNGASCQTSIFSIEGKSSKNIITCNLNTIGSTHMATRDGASLAVYVDNVSSYQDTIAFFKSN